MASCEICARPLAPAGRGRPPRYCSSACRARAYRSRKVPEAAEPPPDIPLTPERIVRAAVTIADRDGVDALSMRRIAAELGAGVMSLYRHVPGKDELVDLVVDAVFGEHPLPDPVPADWRAALELSARQEWAIYQQHPWLATVVAATSRPPLAVELLAYTDWRMRAVACRDLDLTTAAQIAIAVSMIVQGTALALAHESRTTPQEQREWRRHRQGAIEAAFTSGRLPMVSRFDEAEARAATAASSFEFGLQRTLDGIAALLDTSSA